MHIFKRFSAQLEIGAFMLEKYRAQAAQSGVYQAARNLRKQGVPIEVARMILL